MDIVFVLFPNDLYGDTSYIKKAKVFLVEDEHFFNRSNKRHGSYKFNILKPIYHRATMRSYYDTLISKKIDCMYVDLENDWVTIVKKYIKDNDVILKFFDPVDRYLEKKIRLNFTTYDVFDTPRFILTTDEMEKYTGALRQTSFYSWIRKEKSILMDPKNHDKPFGDKLTYDKDNRKRPYAGIEDDMNDEDDYTDNQYVIDAFHYIKKNFKESNFRIFGDVSLKDSDKLSDTSLALKFPIDRQSALARLKYFIKTNLSRFGDYQDVMIKNRDNSFIFHSGLSPMLNIGLITPEEVINSILSISTKLIKKYLNDIEGFIRQIIGWREFVRYMYQHHSDKYINKNFFNANNELPDDWYNATTGIYPIDLCIEKAYRFGYLHHIERLMVIANYMTLIGTHPKYMYAWFMEFSLDSYDWVMEYNIYCMATYSDGGHFTSKPYISSSNYLLNMSTYNKYNNNEIDAGWIDLWDNKFWEFLKKHKEKVKKIGRLAGLLRHIPNK